MFNKEKKTTFTSEITARRFKLSLVPYTDEVEMRVSEGRVTIEVSLQAIGLNSFQDEQVEQLLYTVRQAIINAETKVVGSNNGNK